MKKLIIPCLVICGLAYAGNLIKVAVIDTGMDRKTRARYCPSGHTDFTGTGIFDNEGHGTNVSGLIDIHAKDANYCQIALKFYDALIGGGTTSTLIKAINKAIELKVDIINYSGGGFDFSTNEYIAITNALANGITVVVAAGNTGGNLDENCFYYPACYDDKIVVVGSVDSRGRRVYYSNYGKVVDIWEIGINQCANDLCISGTSQATAVTTGKLIYKRNKQK